MLLTKNLTTTASFRLQWQSTKIVFSSQRKRQWSLLRRVNVGKRVKSLHSTGRFQLEIWSSKNSWQSCLSPRRALQMWRTRLSSTYRRSKLTTTNWSDPSKTQLHKSKSQQRKFSQLKPITDSRKMTWSACLSSVLKKFVKKSCGAGWRMKSTQGNASITLTRQFKKLKTLKKVCWDWLNWRSLGLGCWTSRKRISTTYWTYLLIMSALCWRFMRLCSHIGPPTRLAVTCRGQPPHPPATRVSHQQSEFQWLHQICRAV